MVTSGHGAGPPAIRKIGPCGVGPLLAPKRGQGNGVIRATTLFIVLTLAGTPTATSVCIGWCGAHEWPGGTATTCHPRMTRHGSPSLVAEAHWCDNLLQYMPFVREDLQQVASGSASDHAVVMVCACLGRQGRDEGLR